MRSLQIGHTSPTALRRRSRTFIRAGYGALAVAVAALAVFVGGAAAEDVCRTRPDGVIVCVGPSGKYFLTQTPTVVETSEGTGVPTPTPPTVAETSVGIALPSPTPDGTAGITATPTPTATASATSAPRPGDPFPEAPLCTHHDDRDYHSLWNSEEGCHYDHTHGDDPHAVDDLLGSEVFDLMGGEISYPWHTPGENEPIKHMSYVWLVERDLPCDSQYTAGCVIAYRAFLHNDLHNVFSTHHSALLEAIVCDEARPDVCGRFLVSGHQVTGDLIIDRVTVIDRAEPRGAPRPVMLHSDSVGNRNFAAWYPVFYAWMRVSTQISDMSGYFPLSNGGSLDRGDFVRLPGNQSRVQPHIIALGIRRRDVRWLDPDGDRIANYRGFVDVNTGVPGCSGLSETCAPLVLENVPIPADYGFQADHRPYREFDISFGRESSGWLTFPGFAP